MVARSGCGGTVLALACAVLHGAALHAAESVTVARTLPSEANLQHLKTVAVLPFDGDPGGRIANAFGAALQQTGSFQMVERAQAERLLQEHQLSVSGLVDEASAAEIGTLLGVQGLIYGSVTAFRVDDEQTSDNVTWYESEKYVDKNGKTKTRMITREEMAPATVRNGALDVTLKVTEVATGRLAVQHSESATRRHKQRHHVKADDPDLPPVSAMQRELVDQVVAAAVRHVSPYADPVRVEIDGHCDSDNCKQGMRLIRMGLLDEGRATLEGELAALRANEARRQEKRGEDRGTAAVVYNLGLIAELKGDMEGALKLYQEAVVLRIKDPNEKQKEACRRVRAFLDAWSRYHALAAH
ncbi:MAG: CsgG/HfaB family protein [Candidatus Latescibacterota bacterium]